MDHEAILTFPYEDAARARLVERSVVCESGAIAGDRTATTVEREGATLRLTIEATDAVALRAGLTTWTALVETAEEVGADS